MVNRDEWNHVLATEPATANQRGAVMAEFERLGFHPARDRGERLEISAALLELDELGSVNELTLGQAGQLVRLLESIRSRGELQAAAWLDAVDEDRETGHDDGLDHADLHDQAARGTGADVTERLTLSQAINRIAVLIYVAFDRSVSAVNLQGLSPDLPAVHGKNDSDD